MFTGKGVLVLPDGRRLPLSYQFGSDCDDTRAGYLFCNSAELDHTALCHRLSVICDDGTKVLVAVMHSSDRYLAVMGRVVTP